MQIGRSNEKSVFLACINYYNHQQQTPAFSATGGRSPATKIPHRGHSTTAPRFISTYRLLHSNSSSRPLRAYRALTYSRKALRLPSFTSCKHQVMNLALIKRNKCAIHVRHGRGNAIKYFQNVTYPRSSTITLSFLTQYSRHIMLEVSRLHR